MNCLENAGFSLSCEGFQYDDIIDRVQSISVRAFSHMKNQHGGHAYISFHLGFLPSLIACLQLFLRCEIFKLTLLGSGEHNKDFFSVSMSTTKAVSSLLSCGI